MDTAWLESQRCMALAVEAEIQGMIAENKHYEFERHEVKYREKDFQNKSNELRYIHDCIMQNR